MNFFVNILGDFMDFIQNIATKVSKAFTGADSGAVLVAIIFYLAAIILIILLTRLIFKLIKSCFCSRRQSSTASNNLISEETDVSQTAPSEHNVLSAIEEFDAPHYLDLLSSKYNKVSEGSPAFDAHKQIEDVLPENLIHSTETEKKELSPDRLDFLSGSIEGIGRDALQQMFIQNNNKATTLSFNLSQIKKKLQDCQFEHSSLVSDETAVYENYNSGVTELFDLKGKLDTSKEHLSVEYAQIFKSISEFMELRSALFEQIQEAQSFVESLPANIKAFSDSCDSGFEEQVLELQKRDDVLNALLASYSRIKDSRLKTEEKIASLQTKADAFQDELLSCNALIELVAKKIDEYDQAEAVRLAAEQAALSEQQNHEKEEREASILHAKENALKAATNAAAQTENSSIQTNIPCDAIAEEINHSSENLLSTAEGTASGATGAAEGGEEDDAESDPIDHFGELKKQWAAERSHREKFAAERQQRAAEVEQRRREISEKYGSASGSNNQ